MNTSNTIDHKLSVQLAQQAIKSALSQDWKEAIRLNLTLLETNTEDVDALNRLAYAHLKSGNLSQAKSTYRKVLKIDKYNPIAVKNVKFLDHLTKNDIHTDLSISPTPTIFLEEPGKTKMVALVHLAPFKILCNIITAQKVQLIAKKHSVEIRDGKSTYIGALPDDLSYRLLRFIAGGNTYDAYIKNISKNTVTVFIRELKRGKKYVNVPSFAVYNTTNVHEIPDINETTPRQSLVDVKEEMLV